MAVFFIILLLHVFLMLGCKNHQYAAKGNIWCLNVWHTKYTGKWVQSILGPVSHDQSLKIPDSDKFLEEVISVFRKNLVIGSSVLKFSDDEWKEVIPSTGLRRHIQEALQKIIQQEEKIALSHGHNYIA